MSFSSNVRKELCALPIDSQHCAQAELVALTDIIIAPLQDENHWVAQRLKKLQSIDMLSSNCVIDRICCHRSYVRGCYIAGGIICNPQKTYHLEFVFPVTNDQKRQKEPRGKKLISILSAFGLHPKMFRRKTQTVVYIKEVENIADVLNIMKAHKSLLMLESMRIEKDIRNTVNRKVNFETANLNKTVNAAITQIDAIQYIAEQVGLGYLSKSLEEVARLRLDYETASLQEIGAMLSPPIGKSGVNHRLRKISEIAEKIRQKK